MIDEQLAAIATTATIAERLGVPVWLRGGWAMDFFLGRVTREHSDIDWFCLHENGREIATALQGLGFEEVTTAAPGQQIDLISGHVDHSLALVRLGDDGEPLVGGGPWAGQPWPTDMLDGPMGRIGDVTARVISPAAQMEIKERMPTWNPRLVRRQQDLDDIEAIRRESHQMDN